MNKLSHDETDSQSSVIDDEVMDVHLLNEGKLWTSTEYEEMKQKRATRTKKNSEGQLENSVPNPSEAAARTRASVRTKSRAAKNGGSQPDFYHGVGPYNDVNLPGVWFFRIPHKVRTIIQFSQCGLLFQTQFILDEV